MNSSFYLAMEYVTVSYFSNYGNIIKHSKTLVSTEIFDRYFVLVKAKKRRLFHAAWVHMHLRKKLLRELQNCSL